MTIFAPTGQTLRGLVNANGTPATQAVAPSGQDGRSLTVADFAATAGARTFYDNADYYSLITPNYRHGISTTAKYQLLPRLEIFAEASFTRTKSDPFANPLASSNPSGSAAIARIPAANPFNPFRQDLGFSLSHEELGPKVIIADTSSWRGLIGARATLPREWTAEASFLYYGQKLFNTLPSVDTAALTAALNQTDPAKALNLFGDFFAKGRTNAPDVYESILRTDITRADSGIFSVDSFARGPLWTLPAGDPQFAFGGTWDHQDRLRTTTAPTATAPAVSRDTRDSAAAFAELSLPVFGKKFALPLVRALEFSLAARYDRIEDAGGSTNPKYALRWQPITSVVLRASYGTGYRAPSLSELERPQSEANPTLTDRRRNGERYFMRVVSGSFPNLMPETSVTWNYGAIVNVPRLTGLSLGVDFYRKEQKNLTASLSAQTLLDNESLFPTRITRGGAGAADTAAGFPGRVTDVDARFSNFGLVVTEGYDFNVNWQRATREWGRWTARVNGTCAKTYKVAFNPGDPLVDRSGQFGFPQRWKGNGSIFWNRNRWGASLFCYYVGPALTDAGARPLGSFTTWDLGGSFELNRRLRFQAGIGNLFDRAPPFANNPFGYDPGYHSPKQRTYQTSVTYRL